MIRYTINIRKIQKAPILFSSVDKINAKSLRDNSGQWCDKNKQWKVQMRSEHDTNWWQLSLYYYTWIFRKMKSLKWRERKGKEDFPKGNRSELNLEQSHFNWLKEKSEKRRKIKKGNKKDDKMKTKDLYRKRKWEEGEYHFDGILEKLR